MNWSKKELIKKWNQIWQWTDMKSRKKRELMDRKNLCGNKGTAVFVRSKTCTYFEIPDEILATL